jgi:hypothetical protein
MIFCAISDSDHNPAWRKTQVPKAQNLRTIHKKQEDGMLSTHCHDMLHNAESLPKDASEQSIA